MYGREKKGNKKRQKEKRKEKANKIIGTAK